MSKERFGREWFRPIESVNPLHTRIEDRSKFMKLTEVDKTKVEGFAPRWRIVQVIEPHAADYFMVQKRWLWIWLTKKYCDSQMEADLKLNEFLTGGSGKPITTYKTTRIA